MILWALAGAATAGAAVWGGAQLGSLLAHGQALPVGAGPAAQALFRLPSQVGQPALAWPEEVRPLVAGPVIYWTCTAVVGVAVVGLVVLAYRVFRWQQVGTERRRRLGVDTRAHLARAADLRPLVVPGPRPGRLILGRVSHRLVATERRDPSRASRRGRGRGRQGDRSAVVVIGPTRCGKTANMVSGILEWEGPAILSSVKDDLLAATLARRAELGEVKVFDPTGSTGQPCAQWSPLRAAATPTGAQKAARMLAGSTRRSGREDVEFFTDLGSQLLWALFWTAAVSGRSMSDVVRWVLTRDRPKPKLRGDVAGLLDLQLAGDDAQHRRWAGDAFHALEGVWDNDPRT